MEGTSGPNQKGRYLSMFVLLMVVDGLQTTIAVAEFGSRAEANPLVRFAIDHYSIAGLWWIKSAVIAVTVLSLRKVRPIILRGATVLMAAVVASNLVQMLAG